MKIIQVLLTVTICAFIVITAAADEHDRLFKRFVKMHQKSYSNDAEKQMRFAIFKKNMIKINELNERHNETDMFGITQFADWTVEEFKQLLSSNNNIQELDNLTVKYEAGPDGPYMDGNEGIDWRKKNGVTPVKYQGACVADWVFSAVAVIESQLKIRHNRDFDASEQELLDCAKPGKGCDGGPLTSALRFVKEKGLVIESWYPYGAKQGQCKNLKHKFRISTIESERGFESLKKYLFERGPFSGVVFLPPSVMHYKKGLFKPTDCNDDVARAFTWLVVGLEYHDGEPYWIIKNSWSERWGEKGFIRFAAKDNLCGINNYGYGVKL